MAGMSNFPVRIRIAPAPPFTLYTVVLWNKGFRILSLSMVNPFFFPLFVFMLVLWVFIAEISCSLPLLQLSNIETLHQRTDYAIRLLWNRAAGWVDTSVVVVMDPQLLRWFEPKWANWISELAAHLLLDRVSSRAISHSIWEEKVT